MQALDHTKVQQIADVLAFLCVRSTGKVAVTGSANGRQVISSPAGAMRGGCSSPDEIYCSLPRRSRRGCW